jgi:uncharacterized protein YkvS
MLLALCAMLFAPCSFADGVAPEIRWTVNVEEIEPVELGVRAGETVDFVTTWKNYGAAKNLHDANTVMLYYRPYGLKNIDWHYSATGTIDNATGGVTRIRFGAANQGTNSLYSYDIVISAFDTTMARGKGIIRLEGTSITGTNVLPRQYDHIDWSLIQNSNVGDAPFVSSYDIGDVREFMDDAQNGIADLDVNSIISRTPYEGSAENLTDFPDYLARSGDITPNSVTNVVKGQEEAGGRIERIDENNVVVHFPIVAQGEVMTTNRLYWIVEGQAIGYVSSNGITMLKGSLQLYEEDLNCNVRAYDGSKTAPSVTFFASPEIGWYRKSSAGSYAWAYAHNSNDVAYINDSGWSLMGTRTYQGYGADLSYCDVSDSYRVAGTNGGTSNMTFIVGILTNETGAVTGTVTKTISFNGGIYVP